MRENEGGAVGLPGVRRMGNKIVAPSFASARPLCPAALTVSDGPEAPHAAPPASTRPAMPSAERPAHRGRCWQKSNAKVG